MWTRKKVKKVASILLVVVVVYVTKQQVSHEHGIAESNNGQNNVDNTRGVINADEAADARTLTNAVEGPLCLHIDPSVRKDEFSQAKDRERIGRVCPGEYNNTNVAWNIDYNVERWFRYQPAELANKLKPIPPPFVERLSNYLFKSDDAPMPTPKKTIPKIFHFIWTDEIIPSVFVDNLKLFRETHPKWTIHFWTLKAGRDFIMKNEPHIVKYYDKMQNVFKADALRYVLIYHIGGAYFDLDSKVIKPIDELAENYECIIGPEPIENSVAILNLPTILANSGFLCKPKHILFRSVIDLIPVHGTSQPGPKFFAKCFNIFLHQRQNNKTASKEQFEIKMAPHDFFEYTVITGHNVDGRMKKLCANYTSHVQKYLSKCNYTQSKLASGGNAGVVTDCENMYDNMYREVPNGKKMVSDACVEWISHGASNREPSTRRYIEHVHYGTHFKNVFKSLNFKQNDTISEILPGIKLHL